MFVVVAIEFSKIIHINLTGWIDRCLGWVICDGSLSKCEEYLKQKSIFQK